VARLIAKRVSAFVQTLGGTLRLFFLPSYSPDRTPTSWYRSIWADTVGRMAVTCKEDFSKNVRRSMRELRNDARKIISFFQKPSLKYTACLCTYNGPALQKWRAIPYERLRRWL